MSTRHPLSHSVPNKVNQHAGCSSYTGGVRLRHIVQSACKSRRFLIDHNRVPARFVPALQVALGKLGQWLERNPHPSEATVLAFPLKYDVQLVMPRNAGGASLLRELDQITPNPKP